MAEMSFCDLLDTLDPRAKKILIRYGDEYMTGRPGNNWSFGAVMADVWWETRIEDPTQPEDHFKNFKLVAKQVLPNWKWDNGLDGEGLLLDLYNMMTSVSNQSMLELASRLIFDKKKVS